jgi:alkaline phosphatase
MLFPFKVRRMLVLLAGAATLSGKPRQTPQNIILMIADGCGYGQTASADFYEFGETGKQVYERFPVCLAVSTGSIETGGYQPDSAWADFGYVLRRPTDSAAAATAMATGEKTVNGAIGMDPEGRPMENIVERFEVLGKATGVVTTVPFANATPAGFAAHNTNRDRIGVIAQSMILESPLDVVMGCGHPEYDEQGTPTPSLNFDMPKGEPQPRLLDSVWASLTLGTVGADADRDGIPDPWTFIDERDGFRALANGPTPKRLLGVVKRRSTLQEEREGNPFAEPFAVPLNGNVPTLAEMTSAALNGLNEDPDGFFVMIEGGAVDWASHKNRTGRMIEEMIDFNRAVEAVVGWIETHGGWERSLLVVTADHETGYPTSPKADSLWALTPTLERGLLLLPRNAGRGRTPGLTWNSNHHTNALVPLYARGSGSDLFLKYAIREDPIRKRYLENTEIGKVFFELNPLSSR